MSGEADQSMEALAYALEQVVAAHVLVEPDQDGKPTARVSFPKAYDMAEALIVRLGEMGYGVQSIT